MTKLSWHDPGKTPWAARFGLPGSADGSCLHSREPALPSPGLPWNCTMQGLGGAHLCEVSVPGVEDCGPEPSIEGHLRKERSVSMLPEVEETCGALLGGGYVLCSKPSEQTQALLPPSRSPQEDSQKL